MHSTHFMSIHQVAITKLNIVSVQLKHKETTFQRHELNKQKEVAINKHKKGIVKDSSTTCFHVALFSQGYFSTKSCIQTHFVSIYQMALTKLKIVSVQLEDKETTSQKHEHNKKK